MPNPGTGPGVPTNGVWVTKDNIAINVVITFLGVFALLGLSFVFSLLMFGDKTHMGDGLSALIALVGTAIGSLGSILAQTRVQPPPSTNNPSGLASVEPGPEITTKETPTQPILGAGTGPALVERSDLAAVQAAPSTDAALGDREAKPGDPPEPVRPGKTLSSE